MARVFRFTTSKFDVAQERPNPFNPIRGESLLLWLRDRAKSQVTLTAPEAEDWGWYSFVEWCGRQYLIGASASDEASDQEWVLQIEKQRSLKERLLGREAMAEDDPCARFFEDLLRAEALFRGVSIDPD